MGKGSVSSLSIKQKLVARSMTERELIGAHDIVPSIVWTRNVLKAQGVNIKDMIMYPDNQSAMVLENNGHMSSTKTTKHINICYFYIKDRIQTGDFRTEYCPTDQMIADFYTMPLQGQLFDNHCDAIMNIAPNSKYHLSQFKRLEDQSWVIQMGCNIQGEEAFCPIGVTNHSSSLLEEDLSDSSELVVVDTLLSQTDTINSAAWKSSSVIQNSTIHWSSS